VSIAREAGASWPIVLIMGVATGTFGGLMRDVVTTRSRWCCGRASSTSAPASGDVAAHEILREVLQHIAAHPDEEIRISDVAEMAGMMESSFSRFVNRTTRIHSRGTSANYAQAKPASCWQIPRWR
jgi:Glycine transporter